MIRKRRGRGEVGVSSIREQGVFGGGTQAGRFDVGEAFAFPASWRSSSMDSGAEAAESFDGFDADENVAQDFVFAGGDFHQGATAVASWPTPI